MDLDLGPIARRYETAKAAKPPAIKLLDYAQLLHASASDIPTLVGEIVRLRGEFASVLCVDKPWPLLSVLERLVAGVNHLLDDHSCDTHGHEGLRIAALRGAEIVEQLKERA